MDEADGCGLVRQAFLLLALGLLLVIPAFGHGGTHSEVEVRVGSYDRATDTYNFTCEVPPSVDQRRFYAIDPIPAGHNESYRSYDPWVVWDLDPVDYEELVHTEAMYHVYCEVQNYSAPPGEQNMASEFHIDLRTDDNSDVPDIYVLDSEGPRVTLKCEPPDATMRYSMSWKLRNRDGSTSFPELDDRPVVNITIPVVGAGWDVACTVNDLDTGATSSWDMPLEVFSAGPAYVPTIEGCVSGEPCYQVSPDGTVPPGALALTVSAANATQGNVSVYINEVLKGTTMADGTLSLPSIVPGIYNLVLRKDGHEDLSTLVPIATGETLSRNYVLTNGTAGNGTGGGGGGNSTNSTCYTSLSALPANCTGTITSDVLGGGSRTVACSAGGGSVEVQAWAKSDSAGEYFEMWRKAASGTPPVVCLGEDCLRSGWGYERGDHFPVCMSGANQTNSTNTTQNRPPIAAVNANTTEGPAPLSVQFNGSDSTDPDGDPLSFSWQFGDGTGSTQVAPTKIYSAGGAYSVVLCVNDGNATTCKSVHIIVENGTDQSICYSSLNDLPANCTGTITSDVKAGSRTIACSSPSGSVQAQAWEKTDSTGRFFEINRQASSGAVPTLCIGQSCLKPGWGYQKGSYFPVCMGGTGNSSNGTGNGTNTTSPVCGNGAVEPGEQCDDGNTASGDGCSSVCAVEQPTNSTSAQLRMAPWYPKGTHAVLVCEEAGFTASSFDWIFGDGYRQTTTADNVYHVYLSAGTYEASCTAKAGATSATGNLAVILS